MRLITDLHIHSHYSLATSKQLAPEYLDLWGKMKGLQVIASGDFTHPGWISELRRKIEPAEAGLFQLKKEYEIEPALHRFRSAEYFTRFILSAEISTIYKKNGKVRKIHSIVLAPDFDTVEKIQQKLVNIGGNITSDGRPILGLDAKDLLELCLDVSENIYFIPAHIWTPWFSVLGAKSGFDSIEECFEDLTPHITAIETGLSTNAPMNWMCSFLDKYTLLSNSDAHSPEKLGRNANIMDCDLSYDGIIQSITDKNDNLFLGTIDMYPQEGKYHYDGHRKCGVRYDPVQTLEHRGLCEKCGRRITVGVMNRIVQLSDRENLHERPNRKPFHSIIPLKEILSEITGVGPNTKTVSKKYNEVLMQLGSELDILLNIPVENIEKKSDAILAEAVRRMRSKEVFIREGFDGEYGTVTVFHPGELEQDRCAPKLFPEAVKEEKPVYKSKNLLNISLEKFHELSHASTAVQEEKTTYVKPELNSDQQQAVEETTRTCLVLAGPGTGKTKTLVSKIVYLLRNNLFKADQILAITFTNKAAGEMKERLTTILKTGVDKLNILTFHKLGLNLIRDNPAFFGYADDFTVIDEDEQEVILKKFVAVEKRKARTIRQRISLFKQNDIPLSEYEKNVFKGYQQSLKKSNILDIDDLVYLVVKKLREHKEFQQHLQHKFRYILVDEFQDINQSQFDLIRLITGDNNLFAIGDANQSIYGFRGADVTFIRNFKQHFPKAVIINFLTSYRCSGNILSASADVIRENPLKGLQKGVKIRIHQAATEHSEAEYIARKIESLAGGLRFFSMDSDVTDGYDDGHEFALNDVVVLCRTKAMMPALTTAFNNHAIPHEVIDNRPFFKEKPVSQILDVYKVLNNAGYGQLKKIDPEILKTISLAEPPEDVITNIVEKALPDIDINNKAVCRLIDMAKRYPDHGDFMQNIVLEINEDFYSQKTDNVKIMTLHASKGLEFKYVFIAGCENKLLPFTLYKNLKTDYAEERRLFYVGMTRSKKYLHLTHVKKRNIRGVRYQMSPSPFLEAIKRELFKEEKSEYKKKDQADNQLTLF